MDASAFPTPSTLDEKIVRHFGELAIDKRRLPMSQLQKRSVPGYVGEWILESIAPGSGPLTAEEAERVQSWADRLIPGPSDQNLIKHRLLQGDTVKILTPVQVEVVLKRNKQERENRNQGTFDFGRFFGYENRPETCDHSM